jgi:hypothetical protein
MKNSYLIIALVALFSANASAGGAGASGGGGRPMISGDWDGFEASCQNRNDGESGASAGCFNLLTALNTKENVCGKSFWSDSPALIACRSLGGRVIWGRDSQGRVFGQCVCR